MMSLLSFLSLWEFIQDVDLDLSTSMEDDITQVVHGGGGGGVGCLLCWPTTSNLRALCILFDYLVFGMHTGLQGASFFFFLWLILERLVLMADQLQRYNWPMNYLCPLCVRNLDTPEHLIMECWFSCVSIWIAVDLGLLCIHLAAKLG